jgi:hypothetical protein
MCRQVCNESTGRVGECCCTGTLSPEDEIRMLEAMKTLEKIRLDGMDRRIGELRKTVKK